MLIFRRSFQLLVPLWIIIGITAWIYPPNNYDSLTYHMPRVAHWIQNQSIEYYPTPIDRQNVMGPGAEYLILFFQLLTGSDRLATLVQFFSFMLLIISTYYVIRIIKLPQKWLPYIMIIATTAPIAIMEASNTKNDLVAALITLSIIISGARFFSGNILKTQLFDFVIIGMCLGVGFLVKPTALIVALPVLIIGIVAQVKKFKTVQLFWKRSVLGFLFSLLAATAVAGPDLYRKVVYAAPRYEVYPLFSEYTADRMWNPVRVLAHNIPFPEEARRFLHMIGFRGDIITKDVFNLHEDMIGNPYQAMVLLAISLLTLILAPKIFRDPKYRPRLLLSFSPVVAWFLFGIMVRDQAWITRLEIPLFYLFPFSLVFLARVSIRSKIWPHFIGLGLLLTAFLSLAYAGLVAVKVPPRPLIPHYFWGDRPSRTAGYYNNVGLKKDHDFFLKIAERFACERIGLISGPDGAVYPLVWRAMISGRRVEYLRYKKFKKGNPAWHTDQERLKWPCIIYATYGDVEHVPNRGTQWISAGDYHTFYRNLEWEFVRSTMPILSLMGHRGLKRIQHVNQADFMIETDNLLVKASGGDPQMLLPEFRSGNFRSGVMRVEMQSSVNTIAQVYYKTKGSPNFSEKNSVKVEVKKGSNNLYFFLPLDEIINLVRFDPGRKKDSYKIQSIEIKGI
ncbi:MAG TPA: hypothetical protein ENI07_02375 [Desulfobacterales bacterium]|nr:hypothetical protein [Desulfobacterales bacterium]